MTDRDPFEVVRAALDHHFACCEDVSEHHMDDCPRSGGRVLDAARDALTEIEQQAMYDQWRDGHRVGRAHAFEEAAEIADAYDRTSLDAEGIARRVRARAEEAS